MSKMKILVLHSLGSKKTWRKSVSDLELSITKNKDHLFFVHDINIRLPILYRYIKYNAIIMGPTFLCFRESSNLRKKIKRQYQFISKSKAYKIALPQDDYSYSYYLDYFMSHWNVDKIYSVLSNYLDILYPAFQEKNGAINLTYTGFISDELLRKTSDVKPIINRELDIVYRASNLPAYFGSIGQQKTEIALKFLELNCNCNLKMNISIDPNDTIFGENWWDFIASSKVILGSNSGSSLIDFKGEIQECVERMTSENRKISFREIENYCFKDLDKKYILTAISPRVIEAGMLGTAQILIEGSYSDILTPWRDYIPLKQDYSNLSEVLELCTNYEYLQKIADNCKKKILMIDGLNLNYRNKNLINEIKNNTFNSSNIINSNLVMLIVLKWYNYLFVEIKFLFMGFFKLLLKPFPKFKKHLIKIKHGKIES